jgi:hypothetical protein
MQMPNLRASYCFSFLAFVSDLGEAALEYCKCRSSNDLNLDLSSFICGGGCADQTATQY